MTVAPRDLTFEHHGAARLDRAALCCLDDLRAIADGLPSDRAGTRLGNIPALSELLGKDGPIGTIAATRMGVAAKPVRAILFDKSEKRNWSLGWHQDRTIAVRKRVETSGFGPWTVKAGMSHVAPPPSLQAAMMTMRIHLDDVTDDNAPLLVALGTHCLGRIAENQIDAIVLAHGVAVCTAQAGDVWCYATPILHASAAAARPARRRVLQIDFGAAALPGGLEWLGV